MRCGTHLRAGRALRDQAVMLKHIAEWELATLSAVLTCEPEGVACAVAFGSATQPVC